MELNLNSRKLNLYLMQLNLNFRELNINFRLGRVTTHLKLTTLTFHAYIHKQLQEIVTKRLIGTDTFNPDAMRLVARKATSASVDTCRALDICRRAAKLAEVQDPMVMVSMRWKRGILRTFSQS